MVKQDRGEPGPLPLGLKPREQQSAHFSISPL